MQEKKTSTLRPSLSLALYTTAAAMRAFRRARPLLSDALHHLRVYSAPPLAASRGLATDLQAHVAAESAKGAATAARALDPTALSSSRPAGALAMPDPALIKGEPLPPKVAALVDAVANLNLIECMLFSEALRVRLGMPDDLMLTTASAAASAAAAPAAGAGAAGAGAAAAAPAAGAKAAPAAAPAAEKTTVSPGRERERVLCVCCVCALARAFSWAGLQSGAARSGDSWVRTQRRALSAAGAVFFSARCPD